MSTAVAASQPAIVSIEARVFPACQCGQPWPQHRASGGMCAGYIPRRPVEDHGVVAYNHPNALCRALFRLEAWCRSHREALERKGAR